MAKGIIAPYGSWRSPISSEIIVSSTIRLGQAKVDGEDIYWIEGRPTEGGRSVIVRRTPDGRISDVTPAPFNARTRVHEYGGGDFAVANGIVYFSNFADQRLYRVETRVETPPVERRIEAPPVERIHVETLHAASLPVASLQPQPITPEGDIRYADMVVDSRRGRLICVCEDHTDAGREPINTLVAIEITGDGPAGRRDTETPHTPIGSGAGSVVSTDARPGARTLVAGNDFYSSPCLSPDGSRLAWLTWNHPNMPWDGTELWVGVLDDDGSIGDAALIAGGPEESIFQPAWSPDGTLYFISDRSGWGNLYRWRAPVETRDLASLQRGQGVEPVIEMEAEFGQAQWVFGMSTYAFAPAPKASHADNISETGGRIVCSFGQGGRRQLAMIDTALTLTLSLWERGRLTPVATPYTEIRYVGATATHVVLIAGSPTDPPAILQLSLANEQIDVLRRSSSLTVDRRYISIPQPIEFPTGKDDDDNGGRTAHAFYYPPQNGDYDGAPAGELPPLVVKSHGGPTSAASTSLDLSIQYWTSRGIAVLDVNYGGSTGYGRAYRQRLDGQWGIVDVDDCVNGARYLADRGLADRNRLAITGGSAGGYTTLCALTFRDVFRAGASHYGVGDVEALARDTHKFESRYLDRLIGPYPGRRDLYIERSPIHYADRLTCPVILLQGTEDKVVPPNQAEMMVRAVRAKGLPFAYVTFEGEGHGFRRAESIKRALEAELYFYSRVFRFALADPVEAVEIENL